MSVASLRTAGYALVIEINADQKILSERENLRTCGIWIQNLLTCSTQNVNILKKT